MSKQSVYQTEAWKRICELYGDDMTRNDLRALAEVLSLQLNIKLSINFKKTKKKLIKWFDIHLDKIYPYMKYHIVIHRKDGSIMNQDALDNIDTLPESIKPLPK